MSGCVDHPCDDCEICKAGGCCGDQILEANLPEQGSWPHEAFAPLGELLVDTDGRLFCHVCGETWDYLGRHIRSHKMTPDEYRAWFGLPTTIPLASESWRQGRGGNLVGGGTPPVLTREQRSLLALDRERRFGAMSAMARQRAWNDLERTNAGRAKRRFDEGHECPECGALVCSWTSRASATSTKRVLCGQRECLSAARSRAAAVANRRRWGS